MRAGPTRSDDLDGVVGRDLVRVVAQLGHLFVARGLLRDLHLAPDSVLFDANTDPHHHFIDEESGRIYDVPWNQIEVRNAKPPPGFEVHAYQVVLRGSRRQP